MQARLNALLDALPFAVWFKDSNGTFEQVNQLFLRFVNKEADEVIGRGFRQVFDLEDARQSEEGEKDVFETGKISQATHSRDQRIFKTLNFPVFGANGRISGTGGFQEDITNLTGSLQDLHRERETLEVLLDNMPFYIFFTDREHRYIRVNGWMARLLRVAHPEDAIGKDSHQFFSRRVARKMEEELRQIIETGKPIINRIVYFEDEGVDGFWMEENKIPIRDERGIITMVMGILKDVTDMVMIENELKNARDKAQESDRLKTSFLANMSHEIRTPMNGIVGFANLLKDPDVTEDDRDLYLKQIERSSNQLLNIIDDIIDISKIESSQLKINNRLVRINDILDEIYSSFFHRIRGDAPGQKKVAFTLKKGNEDVDFTIVTDDFRLSQIFNNLIANAIKFTQEGFITFGYSIKNNRYIEFFVSDSGIGIPADQVDRIFDRFGQVSKDETYQPSGTGLGLPISRSLVQLMGGEMWLETKEGKGSTFYFTLPLVVKKAISEQQVLLSNKSYQWEKRKIVVAEDEELNWMFIREMLRKTGVELHRAKDGREAVDLTRGLAPDVVLMDLKMPELNGIEAVKMIREFNPEVPIIAQTAFVMAEEKEESIRAGCTYFVTKPLDRTVVMELIDRCFREYHSGEQLPGE